MKIIQFLAFLGTVMVFPFQTLQMFNIGLTTNEISIIMGAVQAISFVAAPITGKESLKLNEANKSQLRRH